MSDPRDRDDTAPPGATPGSNPEKDPADWVTGDEPMTGPQRSYLETLSREAGVDVAANLTKAEASRRIDELQARTGRGRGGGSGNAGEGAAGGSGDGGSRVEGG